MSFIKKVGGFLKEFPIVGDVISAAGDWLGSKNQVESAEKQNADNIAMQREFAQHGVRWKVEDAQRSGVHPLFALGAQTQGFTPGPVIPDDGGFSKAGQTLGNAVKASSSTGERAVVKAQLESMKAQDAKNYAEAAYWGAMASKERQGQPPPWPQLSTDQDDYARFGDPQQVYNPYSDAIVRRANPELMGLTIGERELPFSAGTHNRPGLDNPDNPQPLWSSYETGHGQVILPFNPKGQSVMEALEGLDIKYWPMVVAENRRRFGHAGVKRLLQLYDPSTQQKGFKEKPGKAPADSFGQMPAW